MSLMAIQCLRIIKDKNHILGSPIAIPSLIKIIHNNEYKNYVISLSSWKIIGLMKLDLGYMILRILAIKQTSKHTKNPTNTAV